MFTSLRASLSRIEGLEAGADDDVSRSEPKARSHDT
jgi:hypothetical protein